MRSHEADGEEKRLALARPDQLDRLGGGLAVGANEIVAFFHGDKRVAAHDRLPAVGITFERFAFAGGFHSGRVT